MIEVGPLLHRVTQQTVHCECVLSSSYELALDVLGCSVS